MRPAPLPLGKPAPIAQEPRAVFSGALARMSEAHDALALSVNEETIRRYTDACNAARLSFEALVLNGFERAKARRLGQ